MTDLHTVIHSLKKICLLKFHRLKNKRKGNRVGLKNAGVSLKNDQAAVNPQRAEREPFAAFVHSDVDEDV